MHWAEKQLRFVKIVVLLYLVFTEYISETSRFVKFLVKKHYTLHVPTLMKKSLRFVKIAVLLYSIFIKKLSVITRFILFYGQIPTSKHDFYFIKRSWKKVSIYPNFCLNFNFCSICGRKSTTKHDVHSIKSKNPLLLVKQNHFIIPKMFYLRIIQEITPPVLSVKIFTQTCQYVTENPYLFYFSRPNCTLKSVFFFTFYPPFCFRFTSTAAKPPKYTYFFGGF